MLTYVFDTDHLTLFDHRSPGFRPDSRFVHEDWSV
jgi:hypothetical protein